MHSVGDLPTAAAQAHGSRPAIVDPDGTVTSWAQLEERVARLAGGLGRLGVEPGDRVAVMLPNHSSFAVAYWGGLRAGATVIPVNPGYTAPEREHIVTDAGAQVVLTTTTGEPWPEGVAAHDPNALEGTPVTASPDSLAPAVICYTSGTTGHPKGARLSHGNLLANLEAFSNLPLFSLEPDDVLLGVLPFFHVFGLNVVLNAAARHGASIVCVDRFSPRGTAATMRERGVTVAYGAPPVFAAFAALPSEVDIGPLRAAVSGADALPVATYHRFEQRYGLTILEGYGLTETSPVLASNAATATPRPGTVGVALPGVRLEVRDPSGQALPTGQVGEIHAAGPNVFDGYHGQDAATAEVLRDGWFATGDLGSFDADGYLTIAGRIKDMVIVSGFNVYPREVEQVLLEHPAVADAAVLGVPDDRTGERVRAVVVLAPHASGIGTDELVAHCRTRLARYKLPREIHVVDALPRLTTGKVARRLLLQAAPPS